MEATYQNPTRWYVVSNRTETVFYLDGSDRQFHFISRLMNEDGRLKEGELDSDKPGKGFSSAGGGTIHHGLDRRFHKTEGAAKSFSARIAADLERALHHQRFEELVLVAEPHFLGLLRESLSPEVQKRVKAEVNKEYIENSNQNLRGLILKAMRR